MRRGYAKFWVNGNRAIALVLHARHGAATEQFSLFALLEVAVVLSLLFLAASTTASPDATNAQMAQLYEEVCLKAFPDDRAVAALMAARGAKELSAEEVRVTMVDDPARAWRLAESDTTVWLEFPPTTHVQCGGMPHKSANCQPTKP